MTTPNYRVFINHGHDGADDIVDTDDVASLAYHHLITREEGSVTLHIVALKGADGKRLDGIEGEE